MEIQIVAPDPVRHIHAQAFTEVLETLAGGLHRLGVQPDLTTTYRGSISPAILIAPHLHNMKLLAALPADTIVYNFEPLVGHGLALMPPDLRQAVSRFVVWDYSARNVESWRADHHADVLHVPVGYDPILEHLQSPNGGQEFDVLFYGSLSKRRVEIIHALQDRGLETAVLFGVYGEERDETILRSKLTLSLHQNDQGVLEVPRLGYLWANRVPLVAEVNRDTEDHLGMAETMICAPYDQIVDIVDDAVRNPGRLAEASELTYERFRREWPEAEILLEAIETSATMRRGVA